MDEPEISQNEKVVLNSRSLELSLEVSQKSKTHVLVGRFAPLLTFINV